MLISWGLETISLRVGTSTRFEEAQNLISPPCDVDDLHCHEMINDHGSFNLDYMDRLVNVFLLAALYTHDETIARRIYGVIFNKFA